jgi:hypothetical protein
VIREARETPSDFEEERSEKKLIKGEERKKERKNDTNISVIA